MKKLLVFLVVAFCFGSIVSAHADPITWNLVNVRFPDGGTANGYIVYDAVRRAVLDFDVRTTSGTALQSFEYTSSNAAAIPSGAHSALGAFSLGTESRQLYLEVDGGFKSPGTLNVDVSSYERCYTAPCLVGFRTVEGQLSSIPEPRSLALLGSALIFFPRLRPFFIRN